VGTFVPVGVLAAASVGLTGWRFGLAAAFVLVGVGATAALWLGQRQRDQRRWIGDQLTRLRTTGVTVDDLAALERRLADRLVTRDALTGELTGWERRWREDLAGLRKQLSTRDTRAAARRQQLAQLQALQNLYAMVPVRGRMPALAAGWAVAPDFMLLVVSLVQERRPATVVELGSGASTAWTALALREFGVGARLLSVEHDPGFAEVTRERLTALGVDELVELRHAPLVDLTLAGEVYPWYDRKAFADLASCDLLVVDGPPGNLRPGSRYPALPMLADRMRPGAQVLVDDYGRAEEREMVARWLAELPGWTLRELSVAKGAALLTRTE
jgi:predicted O-methyltransferase YrrM